MTPRQPLFLTTHHTNARRDFTVDEKASAAAARAAFLAGDLALACKLQAALQAKLTAKRDKKRKEPQHADGRGDPGPAPRRGRGRGAQAPQHRPGARHPGVNVALKFDKPTSSSCGGGWAPFPPLLDPSSIGFGHSPAVWLSFTRARHFEGWPLGASAMAGAELLGSRLRLCGGRGQEPFSAAVVLVDVVGVFNGRAFEPSCCGRSAPPPPSPSASACGRVRRRQRRQRRGAAAPLAAAAAGGGRGEIALATAVGKAAAARATAAKAAKAAPPPPAQGDEP
jgi:hypothetical protein